MCSELAGITGLLRRGPTLFKPLTTQGHHHRACVGRWKKQIFINNLEIFTKWLRQPTTIAIFCYYFKFK